MRRYVCAWRPSAASRVERITWRVHPDRSRRSSASCPRSLRSTRSWVPASGVAIFMLAVTVAAVGGGALGAGGRRLASLVARAGVGAPRPRSCGSSSPGRDRRGRVPRDRRGGRIWSSAAPPTSGPRDRARAGGPAARLPLDELLSGEVPDRVLDEFVRGPARAASGWSSCQVQVDAGRHRRWRPRPREASRPRRARPSWCPSWSRRSRSARSSAERPAAARPFTRDERELLEAAARQAAAALDRARLDARARLAQLDAETNQLRAAMFRSVTHDLRTPLASIKAGVTSLLDRASTTIERERSASCSRRSSRRPTG